MKRMLRYSALILLMFSAMQLSAQEYDNINNRYGPPTYTGGTVASSSENFALYHQALVNARRTAPATAVISTVYPNPALTYTRIELGGYTTEPVTVSLINLNGVVLRSYEYPVGSRVFDLDVSFLPDGIYALQVQERGKEAQSIQLAKSQ